VAKALATPNTSDEITRLLNPCARVSSGAKAIATFKRIKFKIMANKPKVIQIKGLVMIDRIGLRKRLINPMIALSLNNVTKSP